MSGFVKLDCGILNSTVWSNRDLRDVFITALLMAEPREFDEPLRQLDCVTFEETGFVAPPGWYGFVNSYDGAIIEKAGVSESVGIESITRLGTAEKRSKSHEFDGRRMILIDGGFVILNYERYRKRDYSTAERARRYRENKKKGTVTRDAALRHGTVTQSRDASRSVTVVTRDSRDNGVTIGNVTRDKRDETTNRHGVTRDITQAYTYTDQIKIKNKKENIKEKSTESKTVTEQDPELQSDVANCEAVAAPETALDPLVASPGPTKTETLLSVAPRRTDPFRVAMAGSGPGKRDDVQSLHSAWRTAVGRPGATLRRTDGDDAYALAEAIDSHGIDDCVCVARNCLLDGWVNGTLDKAGAKHLSISYIFGNEETFSRILSMAKEKLSKSTTVSARSLIERNAKAGRE